MAVVIEFEKGVCMGIKKKGADDKAKSDMRQIDKEIRNESRDRFWHSGGHVVMGEIRI